LTVSGAGREASAPLSADVLASIRVGHGAEIGTPSASFVREPAVAGVTSVDGGGGS
jgi:hypothetical protein